MHVSMVARVVVVGSSNGGASSEIELPAAFGRLFGLISAMRFRGANWVSDNISARQSLWRRAPLLSKLNAARNQKGAQGDGARLTRLHDWSALSSARHKEIWDFRRLYLAATGCKLPRKFKTRLNYIIWPRVTETFLFLAVIISITKAANCNFQLTCRL